MNKLLLLMVVLLCAGVMADDLCTDTDGGGGTTKEASSLKNKGSVKYGLTTLSDVCLTYENGVSVNASRYLKEYYCSNDERKSKVYDCVSLGFDGCVDGECKGTTGNLAFNDTNDAVVVSSCGDDVVDKTKGEECDPPGSICFGRTTSEYGTCQPDCTCKVAASALKDRQVVCGDGFVDSGEECEKDDDCTDNYVCSSCKCVKVLSQAEIDAMKNAVKKDVAVEIEEKYKAPEIPEVNLTGTNFSDDAAIKATSSIANFFKKIFGWIAAIFS